MLKQPRKVTNVDGTNDKARRITQKVTLDVNLEGKTKPIEFFVTNTGTDDFIFGFSFLTTFNPTIDWTNPQIGPIKVSTMDQGKTTDGPKGPPPD
jgi:hypothetical protein